MSTRLKLARSFGWLGVALGVGGGLYMRRRKRQRGPMTFAVTIAKSPREVYEFFRNFERLPVFMSYLESVIETGATTSHWVAKLPVGGTVEWDAEIVDERPGEVIAWRSIEGSKIDTHGLVMFTPGPTGQDTEVRVEMQLGLHGRPATHRLAQIFAKPELKGDLRRLKQVLETGEVLRSDASAHKWPHPAQPAADAEPAPPIFVEPERQGQPGDRAEAPEGAVS